MLVTNWPLVALGSANPTRLPAHRCGSCASFRGIGVAQFMRVLRVCVWARAGLEFGIPRQYKTRNVDSDSP